MPDPLFALTLRQPWATAVRDFGKRVENRSWKPPAHVMGQYIAIHAGLTFDEAGADWLAARTGRMTTSGNVPRGAVIALARVADVVSEKDDLWFSGPKGWCFDEVIPVEPVSCSGRQSLWAVPEEVRQLIQAQLKMSDLS